MDTNDNTVKNYLNFLRFTKRKIEVEQFKPGADNQFILLHDTISYAHTFKVQNLYANGWLWTGEGNNTRYLFPDLSTLEKYDIPQENSLSCVLKINYGDFSYLVILCARLE